MAVKSADKLRSPLLYDDKLLLQKIATGDEQAFRALFDTYRERLYHYTLGFVKSGQVAEELVMDVFMKLWLGRDLLTRIHHFDAFLFRVAYNKTIDFLRSAAKDHRLQELLLQEMELASDLPSDLQADYVLLHHEFEEKIREAISLLSPQRKKVYQLSREQDLTHDQIAVELNLSKATVNNHIVEAKNFIRNYLSNKFEIAMVIVFVI